MASLFGFLGRKTSDDGAEYGAFHVKCGSNIVLSNGRRTAHGKGAFNGNIVYSSKPFPTGGKFQMKVLEKDLFGPITIGFTRINPENIDLVPEHPSECWENVDYWMFSGSTAHHAGIRQALSFSTDHLVKGDSIGVQVNENGDAQYYVNGQNKGRVFQHLPQHQDLWGVVFIDRSTIVQSEFCFDLTRAQMSLLQEKVSRLEVAVQEKKGVATTPPGGVSRGESEKTLSLRQQLASQREQLTTQGQQLASQQEHLANQETRLITQGQQLERRLSDQQHENRKLTSRVENLTRQQASLQDQNQLLTTQVQQLTTQLQQLTRQVSTLHQQNREQNQQLTQLTTHVQQQRGEFPFLQHCWSIAEHHLQLTTQVLGRGAWGEVKVGIYQGTRVAVKKIHDVIISNHNRELFEREMIIASRVRHPHLVLFIGAVTTGNLTIVSELMETSLRKLLEENKLKISNLHPISKDIACALAYLHSLPDPIVHRDVSSANVLLNAKQDGWCAKLSDFGSANFLAKLVTIAPGAVIYSAPEALDPRQQGPKMDVYSFGILLYEMCVGKLIDQHNLQTTRATIDNCTNQGKKFLGNFASRCTETNPDKRPDMADFVKQV